jgi:hypothetical protein
VAAKVAAIMMSGATELKKAVANGVAAKVAANGVAAKVIVAGVRRTGNFRKTT